MAQKKNVVLIGLDPAVVDYSKWPGLTPEKLRGAFAADAELFERSGFDSTLCLVDLGQTAQQTVQQALGQRRFDIVLIGAGVRTSQEHFLLFEKLVNVVHEHAPGARICFNTGPTDSVAAALRWA